jgi:hypothetical protein
MYVAMEGLLSAEAAPLRRRLRESLNGDVPIVVPAVFESTCPIQSAFHLVSFSFIVFHNARTL